MIKQENKLEISLITTIVQGNFHQAFWIDFSFSCNQSLICPFRLAKPEFSSIFLMILYLKRYLYISDKIKFLPWETLECPSRSTKVEQCHEGSKEWRENVRT